MRAVGTLLISTPIRQPGKDREGFLWSNDRRSAGDKAVVDPVEGASDFTEPFVIKNPLASHGAPPCVDGPFFLRQETLSIGACISGQGEAVEKKCNLN